MKTMTDRASSTFLPARPLPGARATEPSQRATPAGRPHPSPVVVTVVGSVGSLTALADQLPEGWEVRSAARGEAVATDLLVIADATGSRVAAALRQNRGTPVVGVVDAFAPTDQVIEVLEAGADACVRSGEPAVVGSHLRACHRRRTVAA